jgi:hypothetical protein
LIGVGVFVLWRSRRDQNGETAATDDTDTGEAAAPEGT